MVVQQLFIHPVKSLAGISVKEFGLTSTGAEGDRQWMVVNPAGECMTQRKYPTMCLISTALSEDPEHSLPLVLQHAVAGAVSAPRGGGKPIRVRVWDDTVNASDCGDSVAAWLSAVLERPCRLVYMPSGAERRVPDSDSTVGFADAYPLLLCNDASLRDFNRHLPFDIEINRFRPNIVIAGAEAWSEDDWEVIKVGENQLKLDSPCVRCIMPAVDPDTAEKQTVVTDALFEHRRFGREPRFGMNVSFAKPGSIRVGDPVTVLT